MRISTGVSSLPNGGTLAFACRVYVTVLATYTATTIDMSRTAHVFGYDMNVY